MRRSKSNIKSPEWLEHKRATINPKNKKDKCFQHTLTLALNHQNIERDDQRISKIKPFLGQYNCKDIDFHQTKKTGKNLNKTRRQLLLMSCLYWTIRLAHKSKYNHKRDSQVILLMITDGKCSNRVAKWHYLVVKSLSALLRGITSYHNRYFYCLNCFHSYSTEKNLKNMK